MLAGTAETRGFADGVASQARFCDLAGLAIALDGSIIVAVAGNQRIRRVALDGTVTTVAGDGTAGFADSGASQARFNNPQGVAIDAHGIINITKTIRISLERLSLAYSYRYPELAGVTPASH